MSEITLVFNLLLLWFHGIAIFLNLLCLLVSRFIPIIYFHNDSTMLITVCQTVIFFDDWYSAALVALACAFVQAVVNYN